jgi:glutathione synthase/RimK-type ligase-like ATP-grasp enzyme
VNRTDVAILVSKHYALDHHKDDVALKFALDKRGYKAQIVAWDDDRFDFETTKTAVIRSCWDYDQRVDDFHRRMREISKKTELVNDIDLILYNSSKFYLKELKEKGINIIPTDFIRSEREIDAVIDRFDADEIVIKPVISASGRNTFKGLKRDKEKYRDKILSILKKKSVMIQKYISTVETLGEKSVVVINGEITYVMLKKPAKDNFLVHLHHGGTYIPTAAEEDERVFCRQILNTFDKKPVYMRVDLLRDEKNNALMLLELELIEPNLYLSENKSGLKLLCESLISRLR